MDNAFIDAVLDYLAVDRKDQQFRELARKFMARYPNATFERIARHIAVFMRMEAAK